MKKLMLLSSIAVLGMLLCAYSLSFARGKGHRGGGGFGSDIPYHMLKHHASDIGLSEEQLSQIEQVSIAAQKETIQLKADKKILELDIRSEMDKDRPDKKTVLNLVDQMNALDGKVKKTKIMQLVDIKSMLTSAQIAKVKELVKNKRMEARNRKMGRRERMRERYREYQSDDPQEPTE